MHQHSTTKSSLDPYTALEAITEAQKIAFAPMIFQTVMCLRKQGVLSLLSDAGTKGLDLNQIESNCSLNHYAVELLLDMAVSLHIVLKSDERYILGKVGHFLVHDKMTQINMDFANDVCYEGMFHLENAMINHRPEGLKVFSDSPTIYPVLSKLPEPAKTSWFEFDHFYSDGAFKAAFKLVQQLHPKHLYDLGGNTGKWAIHCIENDPDIAVTVLDLPEQIQLLKKNIHQKGYQDRIQGIGLNILQAELVPNSADVWWMSQFLDCFSIEQITHILKLIHQALPDNGYVCILDIFGNRQSFAAGEISVHASSLYFTCMANGNSRFYHSDVYFECLKQAGFVVKDQFDGLGVGHTLLICQKNRL